MPSIGERLRNERETRNTSIEEIGRATGIGLSFLEALEKNEFHVFPGPSFGKLYIRAYARVLGFDPRPLIDDYDREQRLAPSPTREPDHLEPAPLRPVEAAITDWKRARMAEENERQLAAQAAGAAAAEAARAAAAEAEREAAAEAEAEREAAAARAAELVEAPDIESVEHPLPAERDVPTPIVPVPKATAPTSAPARSSKRRAVVWLPLLGLLLTAAGVYLALRTDSDDSPPPPTVSSKQEIAHTAPPPLEPASQPRPVVDAEPAAAPVPTPPAARATPEPGRLSVPEFGVGRRIVQRRLEGRGDRFAEGEVVRFLTRVVGGKRGEAIRHVWLHDGRTAQTIDLRLGGADWRTNSSKTLQGRGPWAVEARDTEGRVLARATFTCGADPKAARRE